MRQTMLHRPLATLSHPPSSLPGPEQLAFFCKSMIRKGEKRATMEHNKNIEL
jgi:hypothetical protein